MQLRRVPRVSAQGRRADGTPTAPGTARRQMARMCPQAGDASDTDHSQWSERSLPYYKPQPGAAHIEEVDGIMLTADAFEADYFVGKRPVLIRGGALRSDAIHWSPGQLVTALQNKSCPSTCTLAPSGMLSTIPYPDEFMPPEQAAASRSAGGLPDILSGHTGYLFCEVEAGTALGRLLGRDLNPRKTLPSLFGKPSQVVLQQLAAGQSGTGAPWHWHQDALNICIVGKRYWYFRPPADALMSRRPVASGVDLAGESVYAVQRPGDVVYIPELWSHCVVNCTLSIAVAFEFGTEMAKEPTTCRDVALRHRSKAVRF